MNDTQVMGAAQVPQRMLDGSLEHRDPGRHAAQLNRLWPWVVLVLFSYTEIRTFVLTSLAGHLTLSWSYMTPVPSGLARVSKSNPCGNGPVMSLRETGLVHSHAETMGQVDSSPGHCGLTRGGGPVKSGVRT